MLNSNARFLGNITASCLLPLITNQCFAVLSTIALAFQAQSGRFAANAYCLQRRTTKITKHDATTRGARRFPCDCRMNDGKSVFQVTKAAWTLRQKKHTRLGFCCISCSSLVMLGKEVPKFKKHCLQKGLGIPLYPFGGVFE